MKFDIYMKARLEVECYTNMTNAILLDSRVKVTRPFAPLATDY